MALTVNCSYLSSEDLRGQLCEQLRRWHGAWEVETGCRLYLWYAVICSSRSCKPALCLGGSSPCAGQAQGLGPVRNRRKGVSVQWPGNTQRH